MLKLGLPRALKTGHWPPSFTAKTQRMGVVFQSTRDRCALLEKLVANQAGITRQPAALRGRIVIDPQRGPGWGVASRGPSLALRNGR